MTKPAVAGQRSSGAVHYTELPPAERVRAVESQHLGQVVLPDDASGLAGMAVCHLGAGTEAGSRGCYVKFGLARPRPGAERRFDALLDACEALAVDHHADHVELGINTGRHEGYSRPGTWLIDDWR